MKRLAVALLVATMTGGCVFLTPPTGIRLGSHLNEFPEQSAGAGGLGAIQMGQYKATDFAVIYPDIWLPLTDRPDVVAASGSVVLRVAIGQLARTGEKEGLQVQTVLKPFDPDPTKNLEDLGDLAQLSTALQLDFKSTDARLITREALKFAGEPGLHVELAGSTNPEPDAVTGATIPSAQLHAEAFCCWHNGRGYILALFTTEDRWTSYSQLFDGIRDRFDLLDGPTVTVCTLPPSSPPAASGAARPSPGVSGSPSPAASGSPKPAASADHGASSTADQAASGAQPRYVACSPTGMYPGITVPIVASGAATPAPTGAASPQPSAAPAAKQ